MAITLLQRVVYPNTTSGDPDPAIISVSPTTAGSTIIIAAAYEPNGGAEILSVTDDAGDIFVSMDGTFSVLPISGPGGDCDLWWCASGTGGATEITVVSTAFHLIWVYEITPSLILDDVSSNAPLSANALQTGPTVTGTGSDEFYLAIIAAHSFPHDSSKVIASVASPWTLDSTVLGGNISNYDWGTYFTATTATLIGTAGTEQAQFALTSSAPAKWAIASVALRAPVPTLSVTLAPSVS